MLRRIVFLPLTLSLLYAVVYQPLPVISSGSGGDSATFTLFDNGSSRNGIDMTLSLSEFAIGKNVDDIPVSEAFAVEMSRHIEVTKYKAPKPVIATKAFREDGELITSFDQLLPAEVIEDGGGKLRSAEKTSDLEKKRRVYLVAQGLEFVWPFIEVGHNQTISTNVVPSATPAGPLILESMSETPRVFRVHNMASDEEADTIIEHAQTVNGGTAMKRSTVGSGKDKDGNDIAKQDAGRTSDNSWDAESTGAKALINRSFQLTNVEYDDGKRDGMQVVRYYSTQGYNTHPDYFMPSGGSDFDFYPYSGGSNRFATVFMYLNDPEEGGHTVFPGTPGINPVEVPKHALDMFTQGSWEHRVVKQCYTRLSVPPKKGTAALFYSITPDGRVDPASHHAACPLVKGTKWGANIWIWNRQRFGMLRTGGPRDLEIVNKCDETIFLSWEGKPVGDVKSGLSMSMNSYVSHRFKASFGTHKHKAFAEFTVPSKSGKQTWTVKPPRIHTHVDSSEVDETNIIKSPAKRAKSTKSRLIHVINQEDTVVCISFEGKQLAELQPGQKSDLNSIIGHALIATHDYCDGQFISSFHISNEPTEDTWVILSNEIDDYNDNIDDIDLDSSGIEGSSENDEEIEDDEEL